MEPVQTVEQVFSPLDEELGLLPGHLTPKAQDHLAHLGSWMPFERASQMLYALLGIQVSEPSVRRGTQKAGARYQARQTAQCQEPAPEGAGGKRQAISLDGAYVPLIKGQWAEVRTLAIGEVKQEPGKTEGHVHTHDLSFFSRMIEADRFAELAEGELRRRGVSQTPAVCAVTDGAPWIQHFIDLHCHDAVRILDLPHVIEHAGVLADALSHAGVLMPEHAAQRCAEVLKRRGPTLLWRWCCRLPDTIKEREAIQAQLEYIRKRLDLMQYPTYLRQGWPIGSGMVESANKVVVQARLKGAGMHWSPHHVNSMLALRTAVCNQRWDEAWQEGIREHANQRTLMRHQRAQVRVRTLFFPLLFWFARLRPTAVASPPSPPPISRASERAATLPGSSCPSAHHPWKRMPVCRPKPSAKN